MNKAPRPQRPKWWILFDQKKDKALHTYFYSGNIQEFASLSTAWRLTVFRTGHFPVSQGKQYRQIVPQLLPRNSHFASCVREGRSSSPMKSNRTIPTLFRASLALARGHNTTAIFYQSAATTILLPRGYARRSPYDTISLWFVFHALFRSYKNLNSLTTCMAPQFCAYGKETKW